MGNLFNKIPNGLSEELVEEIVLSQNVRIERILSFGHSSPETGWYDQEEDEWVTVLSGHGMIQFESGPVMTLKQGDYLTIKAREKHKVLATSPDEVTVWLAVFYPSNSIIKTP